MTIKQFISNISIKNAKYVIKGYYLNFIQKQYSKHFGQQNIMTMMYRAAQCHKCIENMTCEHCGCGTYEMIMSGKPCKRFENGENK